MAISMNNHVFKGHKTLLGSKFVTYKELELSPRYDLFEKSKSGFDWGTSGSPAIQLAFAMLYQVTQDKTLAKKYAVSFVRSVISQFTRDWIYSANELYTWIDTHCEDIAPKEEKKEKTPVIMKKLQPKKSTKTTQKPKTNVVKEVCKELKITQKALAEILEVPEGTVSSWAVKNEIPRLGKKAIEFYILSVKNQKIVDSYRSFKELLEVS